MRKYLTATITLRDHFPSQRRAEGVALVAGRGGSGGVGAGVFGSNAGERTKSWPPWRASAPSARIWLVGASAPHDIWIASRACALPRSAAG